MPSYSRPAQVPPLTLWEKLDLVPKYMSVLTAFMYNAITGIFRGKSGAKTYKMHVVHAAIRAMGLRFSPRQFYHHMNVPTVKSYEAFMKKEGLVPESVDLPHGAAAHWIGNSSAKNVVIYYHGGGFNLTASPLHFEFYSSLVKELTASGHDIAVFFVSYSVTPEASYPTQLRQAVEALRYILTAAAPSPRTPSEVVIGGDSAGGNLALGVLSHLLHAHPQIEPLELSAPLAGVFAFAPWVSFFPRSDGGGNDDEATRRRKWASLETNKYKDLIAAETLDKWSAAYLDGKPSDNWSEPGLAPADWWVGGNDKAKHVIILAGGDEVLCSSIEAFAEKFKAAVPNTTYVVGHEETHVAPVYSASLVGKETQQGRELKRWLAARL